MITCTVGALANEKTTEDGVCARRLERANCSITPEAPCDCAEIDVDICIRLCAPDSMLVWEAACVREREYVSHMVAMHTLM